MRVVEDADLPLAVHLTHRRLDQPVRIGRGAEREGGEGGEPRHGARGEVGVLKLEIEDDAGRVVRSASGVAHLVTQRVVEEERLSVKRNASQ